MCHYCSLYICIALTTITQHAYYVLIQKKLGTMDLFVCVGVCACGTYHKSSKKDRNKIEKLLLSKVIALV